MGAFGTQMNHNLQNYGVIMLFTLSLPDGNNRVRKMRDIIRILRELARHLGAIMNMSQPAGQEDGGQVNDTDGSTVGVWKLQKSPDPLAGYSEAAAAQMIRWARNRWTRGTDDIEIDDKPNLTRGGDPGCWVDARVWVPYEDAKICATCKEDDSDGHFHCGGEPNGERCGERVEKTDTYVATLCGTFCNGCMSAHARECAVCAAEYELPGRDD
jgi:hypothetical protein